MISVPASASPFSIFGYTFRGDKQYFYVVLAYLVEALAAGNVEARRMQRAFDLAVFLETLRQQGIGVGADVLQRTDLVVLKVQADVLAIDFHPELKVWVELIARCDVMPFRAQIVLVHAEATFWVGEERRVFVQPVKQ